MLDRDISTADALRHLHVADEHDRVALDRRRFLQLVGMGMGAGVIGGTAGHSLLGEMFGAFDPSAFAAGPVGPTDGILVVIGMYGGNDGLNTVVPTGDGNYYTQHGALAIAAPQALPIAPGVGLHPNLTEVKKRWDMGQVAVVEGVGYPNPDFSHFNSMAYWMGGQPSGIPTTGWIGRWLDLTMGAAKDLYAAVEVGASVPLHLVGSQQRGTAVPPMRPEFGAGAAAVEQRMYNAVRAMRTQAGGAWHEMIAQTFTDQLDLAATIGTAVPTTVAPGPMANKLEVTARLINANLGFRVLTAGWNDFDSHANQPEMHTNRMVELNAGLQRFFEVLDPIWASRVTVVTFSEFGRTSWANDGQGTDHGSAAPHFVIGQNVRGGFYGQRPTLQGLTRWQRMAHHIDFRSYYASLIDGWLGGGSSTVLGGNFANLGLFARGPGINPDGSVSPVPAVVSAPSTLVPVTPFRVVDTRNGHGGVLMGPMAQGQAIRVPIAGRGPVPATGVVAVAANVTAVDATSPSYFTVYPGSTARPGTSNLNSGPGRPVPNLVVMGVGTDGCIEVYNALGQAHCLVDVFGYFVSGQGDRFVPVDPARLFDTRTGVGVRQGKVASQTPIDIQVAGTARVPASGASAVVINLTVTEPESPGWMRLTPTGETAADTSNVNFFAGDVTPNLVICKIGAGGQITLDGFGTGAHVLGDVFGYFSSGGSQLRALAPQRVLDTREGIGAPVGRVGPTSVIRLPVSGRARVPAGAAAVVLNVTATNVDGPTFVTVWPAGTPRPDTSNLNVVYGQTVANLVICRLGTDGTVELTSGSANCDLVADVLGYFTD
jgi:uncharacterized protein (DUF1501 family)